MTLSSPALHRAHEKFEATRLADNEGKRMHYPQVQLQHPELAMAQMPDGFGRYIVIRYCTSCLRGTIMDLKRGQSDLPNAHELGLKRAIPWTMKCLNTELAQARNHFCNHFPSRFDHSPVRKMFAFANRGGDHFPAITSPITTTHQQG